MARRQRVRVLLDAGNVKALPERDIRMILRAADELISTGGRNMLVKILKGSKDKKVLEHKLDQCPAYGYYKSLTAEEVSSRVDWMIEEDYLRIEYSGRLPMLVFSEKGWDIEEETFAEELYQRFYAETISVKSGNHDRDDLSALVLEMKDVNRQVVWDVLEKIRASKNDSFLPILEAWRAVEVRKVRERISGVERSLGSPGNDPGSEIEVVFRKARKDEAGEITKLVHKTIRKIYPGYYPEQVTEFFCMLHSKERIQADIQAGSVWVLVVDGAVVGTGTLQQDHIGRVYILPQFQRKGYGTTVMQKLEEMAGKEYDKVVLDSSLPAQLLYEKLGYHTLRHQRIPLPGDVMFVYEVMEKRLRGV